MPGLQAGRPPAKTVHILLLPNEILLHGIPTYLATYQRAFYAKKQVGWPPGMPGPQAGHPPAKTVYTFCPNI